MGISTTLRPRPAYLTPPEEPSALPRDPANAVLYCRERFVVDSYEVIGTDPDFEYPTAP